MISQFFILSPRGDTIVARDYLGNVPKVNKKRRDKEKEKRKRKRRGESDVALSVVLLLAPGVLLSWFPLSPPPARARSARDQADDSNFSPPVTHTHTQKKKKKPEQNPPQIS